MTTSSVVQLPTSQDVEEAKVSSRVPGTSGLPPCPPDANAVTAMAHRLRTPEGKAIYAKRKSTVETVLGIIKQVMGFR